jgi:hypothetical protein
MRGTIQLSGGSGKVPKLQKAGKGALATPRSGLSLSEWEGP